MWGEITISIGMAIVSFLIVESYPEAFVLFLIGYVILLFGFIWIMQWRYSKESREHVITFVTGIVLILGIAISISIPNFLL